MVTAESSTGHFLAMRNLLHQGTSGDRESILVLEESPSPRRAESTRDRFWSHGCLSAHVVAIRLVVMLAFLALALPSGARDMTWEFSVQVSAQLQTSSPPAISFSWPQDMATLPEYYAVSRKAPTETNWGPALTLPGTTTNYVDTNVLFGVPYEYQFYKYTTNHVGYGYICSGIELPLVEKRGKLLLLVDATYASQLSIELARLQQDLVGDGWTVVRHDVSRDLSVPAVKSVVAAEYATDPTNLNALFIFGHVPVPYSGEYAPDGHPGEHTGAWPADVYYAEMQGLWTDVTVSNVGANYSRNWNVPGDGKFDQSETPGPVLFELGRVDLSDMPGIDTNGVATFPSELELLRRYLNKDHAYRYGCNSLPARGVVYNSSGDRGGEAFADDAWRNYAALLGPPMVQPLWPLQFLPLLTTNGCQWAYATSGSDLVQMSELGGSDFWYYGASAYDIVQHDLQANFTMFLGSWFGDWNVPDDFMRSVLATPTYGLSTVYAGRPHWYFHYLGIGETLGYCARLTQNNHADGLYQNQSNNFAGGVHIELLGDPTLRMYVVPPVLGLKAVPGPASVALSWLASNDPLTGYHVYRSETPEGPFTRLTSSLLSEPGFVDSAHASGTYMVRAVKLQTTPSSSFYNPSQGAFITIHPLLVNMAASTNQFTFSWPATVGQSYRLLWSSQPTGTNWGVLCSDLLATQDNILLSLNATGASAGTGWTTPHSQVSWNCDGTPQVTINNTSLNVATNLIAAPGPLFFKARLLP